MISSSNKFYTFFCIGLSIVQVMQTNLSNVTEVIIFQIILISVAGKGGEGEGKCAASRQPWLEEILHCESHPPPQSIWHKENVNFTGNILTVLSDIDVYIIYSIIFYNNDIFL